MFPHCPLVASPCLASRRWECGAGGLPWQQLGMGGGSRPSWWHSLCFWTAECLRLLEQVTDAPVSAYFWEKRSFVHGVYVSPGIPVHPRSKC